MLFSSIIFIYYFLPILLLFYFIVPFKFKNSILLFFSLLFYFFSEPKYIILLLLSCIINYILSLLIYDNKHKKKLLVLDLLINILLLIYFKYTDFIILNINNIFNTSIPYKYIIMPIGISFFTFQIIGYIIDVYKKNHKPAKNIFEFMTYVSLFPQLIAGPIVRFSDIENELRKRDINFKNFSEGIKRFTIGLAKKVIIANCIGEFCALCTERTVIASWLRPLAFTFQIYFDFSGYSDMAIGLGLMFGFKFLENFNYPLIASSITDFWRRWHISLSSWFRDYIYIPLGGNKVNKAKWVRNIFIVWGLTGLWHGASWNFIIWGLYFGILLVIEKLFLNKILSKTKIIKYIYTFVIVVISFLIFNTEDTTILQKIGDMFFINNIPISGNETLYYFRSYAGLFIISFIAATPIFKNLILRINKTKFKLVIDILEPIYYLFLLTLCTAFLIDASFNPFLYFRF